MLNKTEPRPFSGKYLKPFFLAAILVFSADGLMAQEKYEYAIIQHLTASRSIAISITGLEYAYIEYDKKDVAQQSFDMNPALKIIDEMGDQGWELFDTGIVGGTGTQYVYYL